ncbi:MAG: hypothetical protein IPM98_20715 [Lewinellaceae bacterium]|nr:hypothetical protein [Lewinellaceae bacterium]
MTRIISIVHIAWLLILVNTGVYAQAPSADPSQDILPPSPSAASITKYVDFPAVSSSGTPSVSVPLGMLGGRGIGIPISLEYHAGGVRVDEVAGIVGLGWSLNAGGVITRTVNGLPDEDDDGFMFRGNDVPTPPYHDYSGLHGDADFASGAWDSQPDIFSLASALIPGNSYSMMPLRCDSSHSKTLRYPILLALPVPVSCLPAPSSASPSLRPMGFNIFLAQKAPSNIPQPVVISLEEVHPVQVKPIVRQQRRLGL